MCVLHFVGLRGKNVVRHPCYESSIPCMKVPSLMARAKIYRSFWCYISFTKNGAVAPGARYVNPIENALFLVLYKLTKKRSMEELYKLTKKRCAARAM